MKNNVIMIKLKHSFLDVLCFVDDDAKTAICKKDGSVSVVEIDSPLIIQRMQDPESGTIQSVPQELSPFAKVSAKDFSTTMSVDDILFGNEVGEEMEKEYRKNMSNIEQASVSDISRINKNKGS